jgi:hypothetical protein
MDREAVHPVPTKAEVRSYYTHGLHGVLLKHRNNVMILSLFIEIIAMSVC